MVDVKQALQDGLEKRTIYLVETRDRNGKVHYTAFDDPEAAKKYKSCGDNIKQVTILR